MTLATGARFRPEHNLDEGDRSVHVVASASHLSFRSGPGSCVIDDYTTSKATYREIACLVSGPGSSAVVVAAAPIGLWHQQAAMWSGGLELRCLGMKRSGRTMDESATENAVDGAALLTDGR